MGASERTRAENGRTNESVGWRPRANEDIKVVVFGAGIAGLTAAHELAERRFKVWVVEPTEDVNADGELALAIGGMARTQYAWAPKTPDATAYDRPRCTRSYVPRVRCPAAARGLTAEGVRRLERFAERTRPGDAVRVTAASGAGAAVQQACAYLQARGVSSERVRAATPALEVELSPRSDFQEDHFVVPGEHGFRFFPSYYRHLFSTMERIPVYDTDEAGRLTDKPTGRNVRNNLVSTKAQALAGNDTHPLIFPRQLPRTFASLLFQLTNLELHRKYDIRDIKLFMLRVLRYMVTGSKRRAAETTETSWWDYLCAYDPRTGRHRYHYGKEFEKDILFSPRVLIAADAEWGDARTNGSTFIQLVLNMLLESDTVDGTLNAPTSEAWFRHWEKYLRALGVTFVHARLEQIEWRDGRVRPHVTPVCADGAERYAVEQLQDEISNRGIDYFVLATDAGTAERLTKDLGEQRVGVAEDLRGFTTEVPAHPRGDRPARERAHERYGEEKWDRFQTLTGVQFLFHNVFKLFDGHVYYLEAPWALSSINHQPDWSRRPFARTNPYRGLLSVDIGTFDRAATLPNLDNKVAWDLEGDQIADEVWNQITDALARYWNIHRGEDAPRRGGVRPDWYHLDSNIDLADKRNRAPYLIPIVGDWNSRPGAEPWDPGHVQRQAHARRPVHDEPLYRAAHGGYQVHWGQWLFAGTYLKHFTRMTTMEAANESARHAVNAILDHMWDCLEDEKAAVRRTESTDESDPTHGRDPFHDADLDAQPNMFDPRNAYIPTPFGDYCHIWDMEKHELIDFQPARDLDDMCFERGLPHPWDLFGLESWPILVSQLPGDLKWPAAPSDLRAWQRLFWPPPEGQTRASPGVSGSAGRPQLPWPWSGFSLDPSVWSSLLSPFMWPLELLRELGPDGRGARSRKRPGSEPHAEEKPPESGRGEYGA